MDMIQGNTPISIGPRGIL